MLMTYCSHTATVLFPLQAKNFIYLFIYLPAFLDIGPLWSKTPTFLEK